MPQPTTRTFNFVISLNSTGSFGTSIYVDWNEDFIFAASEKVYNSGGFVSTPISGAITIPPNTPVGQYRMRIIADYSVQNPLSCTGTNGEAEDYILNVITPP